MGQVAKAERTESQRDQVVLMPRDSRMHVKLVSKDPDLYKLCREIVGEMANPNWTITAVEAVDTDLETDLYIGTFVPIFCHRPSFIPARLAISSWCSAKI